MKKKPRSVGPPSGLRLFEADFDTIPAAPRAVPELNLRDWFGRLSSFVIRGSSQEDHLLDRLDFSPQFEEFLLSNLRKYSQPPITKHFVRNPGIEIAMPPIWPRGLKREHSIKIGEALFEIAKQDPKRLQYVASRYPYAATKRMRICLHEPADAKFGRNVLALVREMSVPRLGWRLVGFRAAERESDTSAWLGMLKLLADTPVHWVRPNNPNANFASNIAIEIIDQESGRISGEFHSVLLWARVVELWRIPRRHFTPPREAHSSSFAHLPLFDFGLSNSADHDGNAHKNGVDA